MGAKNPASPRAPKICRGLWQDTLGDAYVLFLLEDSKTGSPIAVVLPAESMRAQEQAAEQVLPQAR